MHIQTNPIDFEHASVEQLLASLTAPLDLSEMWPGRLHGMLSAVLPALVELRDAGHLVLNKGTLYEYLELSQVVGLTKNPLLCDETRAHLNAYLTKLPHFPQEGISPATEMLHGFLTMQVSAILK